MINQRNNNGQGWRRLTEITNDTLEQFEINF